eukprot:1808039-Prymnesium_polylepis.2
MQAVPRSGPRPDNRGHSARGPHEESSCRLVRRRHWRSGRRGRVATMRGDAFAGKARRLSRSCFVRSGVSRVEEILGSSLRRHLCSRIAAHAGAQ